LALLRQAAENATMTARTALATLLLVCTPAHTFAQASALFKDADLKLGEQLIKEHRCDACHARRHEGNPHAIYRPKGRINAPGLLRGMVEYCNTELNLQLFPEEVTAIAAVLNRDHYRFKP
jgi:cytochrome c553